MNAGYGLMNKVNLSLRRFEFAELGINMAGMCWSKGCHNSALQWSALVTCLKQSGLAPHQQLAGWRVLVIRVAYSGDLPPSSSVAGQAA